MTTHAESRREPLPGALLIAGVSLNLTALRDAVVLLLERHETTAYNEWPSDDFKRLQNALTALGGKGSIHWPRPGKHAPGRDPLCAVCALMAEAEAETVAGRERLLAEIEALP